jgi:tryptophanyl-tRNA synthetase
VEELERNYRAGNYGYGHAKQALFELVMREFESARFRYESLMANREEIDAALALGAEKARKVARNVLQRVRHKVGYL